MTNSSSASRRPGMMDVARLAGVSPQTVSCVLNDPESVRPVMREKVREAMAQLGYRRSSAARSPVAESTRTIGIVTAGSHFFGPASTVAAIEIAARRVSYASLVIALNRSLDDEVAEALHFLIARGVDGIIVVAPQTHIVTSVERAAWAVPLVVVADGFPPSKRIHVVSVDQELGARTAVGHLLGLGCQSVAHVRGPLDCFDAAARVCGWRAAVEEAGAKPGDLLEGDGSPERGYEAGAALVARGLPDGVFCSNDLMALGVLAALRDRGIRVPEDVAVVGYDDVSGAAFFSPSLTTVRQPFDEVGRLCMEVLLEAIGGAEGTSHSISPTLQVRRSST